MVDGIREEREERQEEGRLVVNAAVVRRDIVGVEKDAFLHCAKLAFRIVYIVAVCVHLLKLVTGVDTSTRPESRSGRAGKNVDSDNRSAAAAPKRSSFSCADMMQQSSMRRHGGLNGFVELVEHAGPLPSRAR
jgi:hypothetical protein